MRTTLSRRSMAGCRFAGHELTSGDPRQRRAENRQHADLEVGALWKARARGADICVSINRRGISE